MAMLAIPNQRNPRYYMNTTWQDCGLYIHATYSNIQNAHGLPMLLNQDLDDKARPVIYWIEGLIIIKKKKKTIFKLIYFYAFAATAYTIQYIKFNFGGHKLVLLEWSRCWGFTDCSSLSEFMSSLSLVSWLLLLLCFLFFFPVVHHHEQLVLFLIFL